MDIGEKVILITGASSGIGEGIAPNLRRPEQNWVLGARRLAAEAMKTWRRIKLHPSAIGRAVRQAIEAPEDVDTNEISIRPTATV